MITVLIVLIGALSTLYIACQQDIQLLTMMNKADIFTQTAQPTVFYHPSGEKGIASNWPLLHSDTEAAANPFQHNCCNPADAKERREYMMIKTMADDL